MKKPKAEPKTTDQQLADLLLQKNEEKKARVERVAKVLRETCEKERVTLTLAALNFVTTSDGTLIPNPIFQLIAMD